MGIANLELIYYNSTMVVRWPFFLLFLFNELNTLFTLLTYIFLFFKLNIGYSNPKFFKQPPVKLKISIVFTLFTLYTQNFYIIYIVYTNFLHSLHCIHKFFTLFT